MRGKLQKSFKRLSLRKKGVKKNNHSLDEQRLERFSTLDLFKMALTMIRLTSLSFWRKHRLASRLLAVFLVLIILFGLFYSLYESKREVMTYEINDLNGLIGEPVDLYANKLNYKLDEQHFSYNEDYIAGGEVAGDNYAPKITATLGGSEEDYTVTVNDPISNVSVSMKPKFRVAEPQKSDNRVVYPIKGKDAVNIYTAGGTGIKEDIVLRSKPAKDKLDFEYELILSDGLEARLESDGSIGIYGVESSLLGDVATGSEDDAELLKKARDNGSKTNFLFSIPAPVVLEGKAKKSTAKSQFILDNDVVTISTTGLNEANYPLTIDPTVYVESARKLMRGNNETNIDFDVDNELIQKSQTTGARINSWDGNLDMSEGIWDTSTAAAGGYVYRSGGVTGMSRPQIVDQETTTHSTNSTSFQMNMPSIRPAGDLYIAIMCHDGTASVTAPAGWTEYADDREFAAYYKVGTDEGGGNEAANYTWTISANEAKAGSIIRVTGFNAADPVSGSPGTGSSGSNTVPEFPATTPDNNATLVIRAAGADNDTPSATGWVPSGHTKIASANSGGQSCGFVAASLDASPSSGVSTGTATLGDSSLNDTWGAASIAINPEGSPLRPQVEDVEETLQNSNSTSFTMNMPSTRPAGDLYIALMCFDGDSGDGSGGSNSGNVISTPSGWTKYANRNGHAAYYKVGTDAGGGNEAADYTFTGDSEKWGGVIIRISNFDTSDPISGTPAVDHSNSNARPVFPAVTPDEDSTLVIRATGADNDEPSATGWVPSGHTKIASGGPTGTQDCAYMAASLDTPPSSGVSTGTAMMGDNNVNDVYGASSIAINAPDSAGSSISTRATLDWASFNSSTLEIESPNPGEGVCDGWCNDPTYNLPAGRRGHSMIAYNGYLYVLGGRDSTGARVSTVFIAKLGANGEPQLWHPTNSNPASWEYWYIDSGLSGGVAKSYFSAVAYNNRLYIIGGQTNASPGGITTVEEADFLPNGILGTWTTSGMQALPGGAGRHMQTAQIYNDTIYNIGGFEGASTSSSNLRSSVYYAKLNADGTMNAWQQATSFNTARAGFGGTFSAIYGAYIYIGGGCTAVNGSGYCTTVASDMQITSMNADGTLDNWADLDQLENTRIGYNFIAWQGGLYRLGGCSQQDSSTGACASTLADVDYGVINPAGEVSTVNITTPTGSGNCTGGSPYNCDLPPTGDGAAQGGQMLSASTVLNGFLYVIGGCTNYACSGSTGNTSYVEVGSDGSLQRPGSCIGSYYGAWCVDNTNKINGNSGVSAPGIAVFNNRIYIVGGIDESADGTGRIYYNLTNTDGSLDGSWETTTLSAAGISGELAYTYAYARADPASAGSNPGNLFVFGGCSSISASAGCSSSYNTEVYKCNISTTGNVSGCTTSGQLQLDTELATEPNQGLGLHSGTVYANYIYLIGGYSDNVGDRATIFYAKFDDNNNVVDVESGTANPADNDDDWIEADNTLSVGRRRGWAFGYNGHVYSVGGYDDTGTGIIPFIEWSKMNVSDGSIDPFVTSSVTINQRWGLTMVVSNSYAYVIGGCDVGSSPSGCSSFEASIQTFQLYNNNSGAAADFTPQSDQTFTADTNRWGASSVIYNGYLYVAGGCISATDCTNATNSVQYAPISTADGTIGTWAAGGNLPADRAWGSLQVAGGTLYYMGGQSDTATDERAEVYYTTGISSGNPTWGTASTPLPSARTRFGAAVWDDRIYVVGGLNSSATATNTVYYSPQLSTGGDINSAWTSTAAFDVGRSGMGVTTYANNLYVFGGYDGSNYLSDTQYASIGYKAGSISQSGTTVTGTGTNFNSGQVGSIIKYLDGSTAIITGYTNATTLTVNVDKIVGAGTPYVIQDGSISSWTFGTRMPGPLRDTQAISANGYIYLVGGRSAASACTPKILITPVSANTTIVTGNNPTGIGEWYETNVRYAGDRYGAAVAYEKGKMYTMGGGCTSPLSSNRHYQSTIKSQPQVARYSRLIDTDIDVFPNAWLMNGVDNSIGARWQVRYRSMNDTDGVPDDCGTADMTTFGQDTFFGDTTLGRVEVYTPKDAAGNNIECARYFYFFVAIDASQTFGYPEDVNRGPTINDLSLFFTSDPSRRLRHGKTFSGGELQPLDTPCRVSGANPAGSQPNCPLP